MTKWSWGPVSLDKFRCIVENINILCNTNGKNLHYSIWKQGTQRWRHGAKKSAMITLGTTIVTNPIWSRFVFLNQTVPTQLLNGKKGRIPYDHTTLQQLQASKQKLYDRCRVKRNITKHPKFSVFTNF